MFPSSAILTFFSYERSIHPQAIITTNKLVEQQQLQNGLLLFFRDSHSSKEEEKLLQGHFFIYQSFDGK
jgi:hypothetical protein